MKGLVAALAAIVVLGACESDSTTFDSPTGGDRLEQRLERRQERRLERREARRERRIDAARERRQQRRQQARIERRLERERERRLARQRERRRERQAAAAAAAEDDGGGGGNCTPGYSPCLPPASDYDCAGGTGDGPEYAQGPVEVSGDDPYGLDDDNDGVGCEA